MFVWNILYSRIKGNQLDGTVIKRGTACVVHTYMDVVNIIPSFDGLDNRFFREVL